MTMTSVSARSGAPLLLTADLPRDVFAWAEGLRRAHYPPERNRVRAHVTLFHALPPSAEAELRRLVARITAEEPAPRAKITGLMPLARGTAYAIHCPMLSAIHENLGETLYGILGPQDRARRKLHVTIQDKVTPAEAKALQAELAAAFAPRDFSFAGLSMHKYLDGIWGDAGTWRFRGRRG